MTRDVIDILDALTQVRILFFVPDGNLATNGVYASQVGGLAKYCETLGAKTMIWDNGISGHMWFYQIPSHFRRLARSKLELLNFRPTHIYVRNFASAIAAKELAKRTGAKLVYSMRGADVAEAMMGRNFRAYIIAFWAWLCVRRAVKLADHVNAVSKTMSEWIWKKYKRRTSVLPCCIAHDFTGIEKVVDGMPKVTKVRAKTVIYSGGLSAWQKIDNIIMLMKRIHAADDRIRFRFLTTDIDSLNAKCTRLGLDKTCWTAKSCRQCEVAGELAKADCGIILRDDILVNQVASPIKIGEYLAAGLGIIASPYIGDVGRDLSGKSFTCLVDENTAIDGIVAFINGMTVEKRQEAIKWVRQNLTYDGNRSVVIEMFS